MEITIQGLQDFPWNGCLWTQMFFVCVRMGFMIQDIFCLYKGEEGLGLG